MPAAFMAGRVSSFIGRTMYLIGGMDSARDFIVFVTAWYALSAITI